MLEDILLALLVCAAALLFYWAIRAISLLPVRPGSNTRLCTVVEVTGAESNLEETLKGLLWLRENGTLKTEIVIICRNTDAETLAVAKAAAQDNRLITLRYGENEWMKLWPN